MKSDLSEVIYQLECIKTHLEYEETEYPPVVFDTEVLVGCISQLNELKDNYEKNCSDCSRRKFYQEGYRDGMNARWIPCSEREPNDENEEGFREYLVWFEYFRYGDFNCLYQKMGIASRLNGEWTGIINGSTGWRDLRIIAWMPLPEDYKEVRDEK